MNVLHTIGTVSLCLYGLLGVACIISFCLSFITNRKRGKDGDGDDVDPAEVRLQQFYHLFLGLFVAVRLTWVVIHSFYGSTTGSFILNRCGFTLFFTAFTIVLFYWAELYHKNYVVAKGFLPRLFNGFVATNALLYISEIVVVVLFLAVDRGHQKREGNPIYESSVYLEIFVSFVVSIAFLIYGMRLFMQHTRASDFEENYVRKAKEIMTILVATLIFTACFFVRVAAFLYRPITGHYMNQELFEVLAYYIPEVIPSLVQFYLISRRLRKEKKDTQFIHDLYQQEEEVRGDDMRLHYTQQSYAVVTTPIGKGSGGIEKNSIKTEKSHLLPRPIQYE